MKKLNFILVVLLTATFANAQVTLEYTFSASSESTYLPFGISFKHTSASYQSIKSEGSTLGNILTIGGGKIVDIDNNYTTIDCSGFEGYTWMTTKGYFTKDNRICFAVVETDRTKSPASEEYQHLYLYDDNKTIIQDLGSGCSIACGMFHLSDGQYMFYVSRVLSTGRKIEIYSLPCNGVPTETKQTSAPRKNNTCKYLQNDQVLIEGDDRTYTVQGQQVK